VLVCLAISCGSQADRPSAASAGAASPTPAPARVEQPVVASALMSFLPEHLLDHPHGSVSEKNLVNPALLAEVNTQYGTAVSLKISDIGAHQMRLNAARLLQWETEEVLPIGIARITRCFGHPCQERETMTGGRVESEVEIFVAGRFLVELHGREVSLNQLKQASEALDLKGLADLAGL